MSTPVQYDCTGFCAMPLQRMMLSASLAFLLSASATVGAAPLAGLELGALSLDRAGAIATTAWPASGTVLVEEDSPADDPAPTSGGVRKLLADFSLSLREVRYRRGGRDPRTGFDCSGFVRYVYQHTIGALLPGNSAGQFQIGAVVARGDMKVGDLVFFRTHGKRISHVGIYLGDNRFIHSPSSGKRVSVSSLDEAYWARRFAGAKRPDVLG